jgi:hypothetical protein
MRARLITEKFTEESDPVTDMGIGLKNNPKVLLPMVVKELKKYGIKAEFEVSQEWGRGFYDLYIEGNDEDEDMDVQFYYATDAAAKTEGWKGGFSLADSNGSDLCKISHDPWVPIKTLLKMKYGNKAKISKYIIQTEKKLQLLKEIEKIL